MNSEALFPLSLIERELKSRIKQCHEMAAIGSVRSREKMRASANELGAFLSWCRKTAK